MPDPNPNSNAFPDPQQPGGEVRDRSLRPVGLLPKNTQTYVILAIAVIMIGAIAFSGGNSPKPASNGQPKTATVIDPNLARIQDYRESESMKRRKSLPQSRHNWKRQSRRWACRPQIRRPQRPAAVRPFVRRPSHRPILRRPRAPKRARSNRKRKNANTSRSSLRTSHSHIGRTATERLK